MMWPCAGWLAARWVWPWKAKKEPWKTKPSDKTFRRKTYLPKACNFHVQMPGSLNWRTKHARKMFTRYGLGAAWWLRDGFDLGQRRRRSSTPAVVPGAAPALAKAGVGGYISILYIYIYTVYIYIYTGWWFGTWFLFFHNIWDNPSHYPLIYRI